MFGCLLLWLSPMIFMSARLFFPFLPFSLTQFHCRSSSLLVSGTFSSYLQTAPDFLSQFRFLLYLKFIHLCLKEERKHFLGWILPRTERLNITWATHSLQNTSKYLIDPYEAFGPVGVFEFLQIWVCLMPFLVCFTGTKMKHNCIKKIILEIVSILNAMFSTWLQSSTTVKPSSKSAYSCSTVRKIAIDISVVILSLPRNFSSVYKEGFS